MRAEVVKMALVARKEGGDKKSKGNKVKASIRMSDRFNWRWLQIKLVLNKITNNSPFSVLAAHLNGKKKN